MYGNPFRRVLYQKNKRRPPRTCACRFRLLRGLREDGVLRGLRHAELHLRARRDLDGRARSGVAAKAGLALRLDELAETREQNALGALRASIGDLEELVVGGDGLLLADASGLSDSGHDLGLGSRHLLCHFFDPFVFP